MKKFDARRARRAAAYDGLFGATSLCVAGLLAMPALLFNPVTMTRIAQLLLFWFLCWLSGKRNNPAVTLLVMLFIIAFNLIVPYGQVLYSVGVFKITAGALSAGIHRAVTLEGLIMLSRVSVRRDLKIPGRFGSLIGESFRVFALITEQKKRVTRKNFIGDIDQMMLDLSEAADERKDERSEASEAAAPPAAPRKTRAAGYLVLAACVLLAWAPWLLFVIPAPK